MKKVTLSVVTAMVFLVGMVSEARVGGGRSFGSRGSRGFGSSSVMRSSPYRSAPQVPSQLPNNSYSRQQPPVAQPNPFPAPGGGSSFLKSMGAGIAGGMLGSYISRSMGWGGGLGGGMGYGGGGGGGGFGFLELLLVGGLLFWLYRTFSQKTQTSSQGAAALMRDAKENHLSENSQWGNQDGGARYRDPYSNSEAPTSSLSSDVAMDLFFQIQGAWGTRDLSAVQGLLESDARSFLEAEISRLKAARQINRLENIAVRNTEVIESWGEGNREFCTIRFLANLLDFTIDEQTLQIVDGSRTSPVKFEELWTFAKDRNASQWRLSAIEQV